MAEARSAKARRSTWNMSRPIRPARCMSATRRGAVFGDALANLLAFTGFAVTREYYVNDAGAQVDALARSAYLRYREALGEDIGAIPEGLYPGDYLKPVGEKLAAQHGKELLAMPEERVAAHRAGRRAASHARHDRGRSRRARHPPRRVLLRALAERRPARRGGRDHRRPQGQGPDLPGAPAAAQGQGRRGLGGPRAAPVPRHRVRRRHRPAAGEIRRHLRLFRRRHRLSPRQVHTRL